MDSGRMLAVVMNAYGPADVLKKGEVPTPVAGKGQVLVKVRAAGINPVDWKFRRGDMRMIHPVKLPAIPGLDLAGDVAAVGPGASRLKIGDAVFGFLHAFGKPGAYAQFAAVPESALAPKPPNLSYAEAAAMPVVAATALVALREKGHLQAGGKVLVLGASGGVGSCAVQIAKILGAAQVTGVCSGRNVELVRSLGCDRAVDYKTEDPSRLGEIFDVILDTASYSFGALKPSLKKGGVFVTTNPSPRALLGALLAPVNPGKKMLTFIVPARADLLGEIAGWLQAGKLRPLVEKIYPASQAAQAHRDSEAGRVRGKLVLDMEELGRAA